jgi:hypothetical protein
MGITLTFESLEEMKTYARELLNITPATSEAAPLQHATPTYQQPVQSAPIQHVPVNTNPANQQPIQTAGVQPATTYQAPIQTTQQSYSKDDLAKAAMVLMDAGRQPELLNLLTQFGVNSLPEIPESQYGAFATALRGLGAQI